MIDLFLDTTAQVMPGRLLYLTAEHSFSFVPSFPHLVADALGSAGQTSLLIGDLQLEVGIATRRIAYVWGYYPQTCWKVRRIPQLTNIIPAGLRVAEGIPLECGVSIRIGTLDAWPACYDPRSGWICIGHFPGHADIQCVNFATETVAVLRGRRLQALLLHPTIE